MKTGDGKRHHDGSAKKTARKDHTKTGKKTGRRSLGRGLGKSRQSKKSTGAHRKYSELLKMSSEIEKEIETIGDGKFAVLDEYSRDERLLIFQSELIDQIKLANDYKDSLQRVAADFDNSRKRNEKERENIIKFANEGLILKFLEVLDNLDRAVNINGTEGTKGTDGTKSTDSIEGTDGTKSTEGTDGTEGTKGVDEADPFYQGIKLIYTQFIKIMSEEGLRAIDETGVAFDPFKHDAMMQIVNNELDENTVTDIFLKGYFLKDKVIRPAKVRISKKEE